MSNLTDRLRMSSFDKTKNAMSRDAHEAADEIERLRVTNKMLMDDKADLLRDQQRKIGALARYHIETQLVGQLLEEGPNTETTALDMEYWCDQHDHLKAALTERDALRADAARYRWLRDHPCPQVMHPSGYGMGNARGEQLDAAIDAALYGASHD